MIHISDINSIYGMSLMREHLMSVIVILCAFVYLVYDSYNKYINTYFDL